MSDRGGQEREAAGAGERGGDIPLAEWVVAAVGLVLVAATVGFMLYRAVWGDRSPPDITVSVEQVSTTSGGYLVGFRAVNRGGSTAEGVEVRGELQGGGGEAAEESQTTLDYLPSHSERRGGLFFTKDPRQYELKVRALGYEEP